MEVTRDVALLATQAAEQRKAASVLLLDLRGLTLVSDFFMIASGTSSRQVKAIAEHVEKTLLKAGLRLLHREGFEAARWVLLDFGGLVCHVFNQADRDFYGLERFWGDAPRLWPAAPGADAETLRELAPTVLKRSSSRKRPPTA